MTTSNRSSRTAATVTMTKMADVSSAVEGYATSSTTTRRRCTAHSIPSGGPVDDCDHNNKNKTYNDGVEEKKDEHGQYHYSYIHQEWNVTMGDDPNRTMDESLKGKQKQVRSMPQKTSHVDDPGRSRKTKTGRRKRRRKDSDNETSFILLLCQVGTTLLAVCLIAYHSHRWMYPARLDDSIGTGDGRYEAVVSTYNDDRRNGGETEEEGRFRLLQQEAAVAESLAATAKPTPPPFPHFTISDAAQWDAFGILQMIPTTSYLENDNFWAAAKGLRERFIQNYGGENAARMIIDQGTTTFFREQDRFDENAGGQTSTRTPPADVVATACRFYNARQERRPFRMAFGGYSVTTGRGNRFEDSYPLQLQRIFQTVVKMAGIPELHVHNAAIGGCPSFPYGWCMKNFWGGDPSSSLYPHIPDIVSWDYSMNESNDNPEGLEAYVRHLLTAYRGHRRGDRDKDTHATKSIDVPKLIVKDHSTARHRRSLLHEYSTILHDAVALHTDRIIQPFLAREEEFRPPGFQRWREWGAPNGAPGQAFHHPAVQEHALNAWILTMHLLSALEYMMANVERMGNNGIGDKGGICDSVGDNGEASMLDTMSMILPPPVSGKILNDTGIQYDPILFGRPVDDKFWAMNPVQCRTTFQPIRDGDLSDIVVSGTIGEELDPSLPKSQMYYNSGWTLDLSESERTAKRRLSMYPEGLGFLDSKEAYYGIYESPHMKLLLPIVTSGGNDDHDRRSRVGDKAQNWIDSIVVCEVNEKKTEPNKCNLEYDIGLMVGGVNITSIPIKADAANQTNVARSTDTAAASTKMIKTVGSTYLGRPICKHVDVPLGAKLTSHNHLLLGSGHSKYLREDDRFLEKDQVGLLVEIYVTNPHIVHVNQACSISHVIWDLKPKESGATTS